MPWKGASAIPPLAPSSGTPQNCSGTEVRNLSCGVGLVSLLVNHAVILWCWQTLLFNQLNSQSKQIYFKWYQLQIFQSAPGQEQCTICGQGRAGTNLPHWGCPGVGAQPHSPGQGLQQGRRAQDVIAHRWDSALQKTQGLCCGWSPSMGRARPRHAGETPRVVQIPSLPHQRAQQAALPAGSRQESTLTPSFLT